MSSTMQASKPVVKYKTFQYQTGLSWSGDRAGWLSAESKPRLRVASPPEFKGEAGVWTPEDLFVAAVDICTMTTFMAFAQHKKLGLVAYETMAEGLLRFVESGYEFTEITLRPKITVASAEEVDRAHKILEDAHKTCLIARSIKTTVRVVPTIIIG